MRMADEIHPLAMDSALTLAASWEAHKRLFGGDTKAAAAHMVRQIKALAQEEIGTQQVSGASQ